MRLSEWLGEVPEVERLSAIRGLPTALREGTVQAVPVTDPSFELTSIDASGRRRVHTLRELAVQLDQGAQTWLQERRRESRYDRMRHTGEVTTSFDALVASEDDFSDLLRLHHDTLNRPAQTHGTAGNKRPIVLTDQEKRALRQLYEHDGAWAPGEVERHLTRHRELQRAGVVAETDTLMGPMTLLALPGRRAVYGVLEDVRSPTRQLDTAYLRLSLRQLGWDVIERPGLGLGLGRYDSTGRLREARTEYGLALVGGQISHGGYSANTLKNVVGRLAEPALHNGVLVVILTPSPDRGQGVAERHRSFVRLVHVLPQFTAQRGPFRRSQPRPDSAEEPDPGPYINQHMAQLARQRGSHLMPELSLDTLQMPRAARVERALHALACDGVISARQLVRHYGLDGHDLAGIRYKRVVVWPVYMRRGLEVQTRFFVGTRRLAHLEGADLAHLAGIAEIRRQLGVLPGAHWQVDTRSRLPVGHPHAVYDGPSGPVAIQYDDGSYVLDQVGHKLAALHASGFQQVVWGVAADRRRKTLVARFGDELTRPLPWVEWWQ